MIRNVALSILMFAAVGAAAEPEKRMSLYDLTVKTLDGQDKNLADYRGKVLVVVNTASECGYTPQYAGLQALSDATKDKGVVVLGFPSNDFGGQEPGTAAEIKAFCDRKYGVRFPMFEKVQTKGEGQSPVYGFLTAAHPAPKWNFHKYVVGKDGQVRASFPSKVTPESKELRDAIDSALNE